MVATYFGRRHFQIQIRQWKCFNYDKNFTEICSLVSNQEYSSIGSDNGLALKRRQAIIWTNDDAYMRHFASMS